MRILFVCLGNICRSPTAEAVMRGLVAEAGLEGEFEIDSAGTGNGHIGHPPDERSVAAAAKRGVELTGEARQVARSDFENFDLLIAMDRQNRDDLLAMAQSDGDRAKVHLLRSYADGELDVPDPYYWPSIRGRLKSRVRRLGRGEAGFDAVVEIVERSCAALIEEVTSTRKDQPERVTSAAGGLGDTNHHAIEFAVAARSETVSIPGQAGTPPTA